MTIPHSYNSCEQVQSYFTLYPIPVAAALWCGIPTHQVDDHLKQATQVFKGVFALPYIKCLEPRCRALHNAIDSGVLPVCREKGVPVTDHVAPERRHVWREDLKSWIAKEFPDDKPAFLFDEVERKTHSAINAETYRVLKAAHDANEIRLKQTNERIREIEEAKRNVEMERDSLKAIVDKMATPGERAETTYLNIIGGLLGLMLGKSPAGKPQSLFDNQAAIISALLGHYEGKPGIAARTLEEKFAAAKRSLSSF